MAHLDEVTRRLLLELQKNARRSNRELARTLGIADSTCLERIRTLQSSGLIEGFHAEVNLEGLDRGLRAMIAVKIHPKSREAVESFRDFVVRLPEVLDVFVVTGSDDFQVLVAVEGPKQLEDFVLDRVAQFPSVADLSASIVYEHLKRRPIDPLPPAIIRQRPAR
ncbi:MAG: Lrp/AsnC family transcriptional regulator [Catenulispora sp.]